MECVGEIRQFDPEGTIDYVIGDVRDKKRVHRAMDGTTGILLPT